MPLTKEQREAEAETLKQVMAKLEEALELSLALEEEETLADG